MGWAVLVSELLKVFGPLLTAWLQKWLESLLQKAAARMPDAKLYATPEQARLALLDEAIDAVPRLAFARRALLRRVRAHAGQPALTTAEQAEFRDLVGAAENE